MSRLRIFTLFAAIAALATALAACGSSGGSSNENPQTVIDSATLQGIESGKANLTLSVDVAGGEGGKVDVSLSGPFQGEGKGQLPQFDMAAKANGSVNGKNVDFEGGLELLSGKGYVNYEGTEYEIDPTTFGFVKSAIEKSQQSEGSQGAGVTACQEAAAGLKVADFIENLTNEGSAEVGGTTTTKISGDLNAAGAVEALGKLTEDSACASQLSQAGELPSGAELEKTKNQLKESLKKAHVDVYVGEDNIIREISGELEIEPPGSASGPKKVDVNFDLKLEGVNEEQPITAPSEAKPLNDLFVKLGVNPIELLGATENGGAGLGSLLEGLGTGGSAGGSTGTSGGESQSYQECLQGVRSAADLQKCASLAQ